MSLPITKVTRCPVFTEAPHFSPFSRFWLIQRKYRFFCILVVENSYGSLWLNLQVLLLLFTRSSRKSGHCSQSPHNSPGHGHHWLGQSSMEKVWWSTTRVAPPGSLWNALFSISFRKMEPGLIFLALTKMAFFILYLAHSLSIENAHIVCDEITFSGYKEIRRIGWLNDWLNPFWRFSIE